MRKQTFWARLWPKLSRSPLIRPGDRILAAVSGGPDSVCLAHFLWLRSRRIPLKLALAHVHHGLRGRSADADEQFVRELGDRWKVPVYVRRVDVPAAAKKEKRSVEDAARRLRYRALAAIARRTGCRKVAVAHHADDQAETLLLHLLRGTDPRGLAGMPARRPLAKGIQLIRPLLSLPRKEIDGYLAFHRLRFRKDATNKDLDRTRNWVRRRLLPLMETRSPRIREHLVKMAGRLETLRRRR